jgi:hypothetical protein
MARFDVGTDVVSPGAVGDGFCKCDMSKLDVSFFSPWQCVHGISGSTNCSNVSIDKFVVHMIVSSYVRRRSNCAIIKVS